LCLVDDERHVQLVGQGVGVAARLEQFDGGPHPLGVGAGGVAALVEVDDFGGRAAVPVGDVGGLEGVEVGVPHHERVADVGVVAGDAHRNGGVPVLGGGLGDADEGDVGDPVGPAAYDPAAI